MSCRSQPRWCLWVVLALGLAPLAWADAGVEPGLDASLPDASVGEGGADRDVPEADDGRAPVLCERDGDCSPNFRCASGRCRYVGPKVTGCTVAGGLPWLAAAAAFAALPRRRASGASPNNGT